MKIRNTVLAALVVALVACTPATTHSHYQITASFSDDADGSDHWADVFIRLHDMYLAGDCGEARPTLRDSEIFTAACGKEPDTLRVLLSEWPGLTYAIEGVEPAAYEAAVARNEQLTRGAQIVSE